MTSKALPFLLSLAVAGCGPRPETPAAVCAGINPGDLVFTEFLNDPEGVDTGKEYLELFNASGTELDLKGLTLYAGRVDGSAPRGVLLKSVSVAASGYLALGDFRDAAALPAWLGYSYGDGLSSLPNTEGIIGVRCGELVIDELRYGEGKPGRARTFNGRYMPHTGLNDDLKSWCDAPAEFTPGWYGSPGAANAPCNDGPTQSLGPTCLDPVSGQARDRLMPEPGDLLFTEVMADPRAVADGDGEWIELLARKAIDLNGLEVSSGGTSALLGGESCLYVPASATVLLARNPDPSMNGWLPQISALFEFGLNNGGGELLLRRGEVIIDQANYGPASPGVSSQLDEGIDDPAANDDPTGFCAATAPFGLSTDGGTGSERGSPGQRNPPCPVPTAPSGSSCVDETSGRSRPLISPLAGELVITELMINPKAVPDADGEWIELLARGDFDLNGLTLGVEAASYPISGKSCLRVTRGDYLIFARNGDRGLNGGLPEQIAHAFRFELGNSGTKNVVLRKGELVLDAIKYTGSSDGASLQLSADKLDPALNDAPASWCATPSDRSFGGSTTTAGDRGTPGAPNGLCP
jgi:hypothetical protein